MFRNYCYDNGIIQKFIAPGHPATNGLAERYVQILKSKLNAMEGDKLPINIKVQQILFRYRATPLANGESPSKLYLGRDIRIKLDAIRPIKHSRSIITTPVVRQINVGERVQLRWFDKGKPTWKFGTIKSKFGRLHYKVKLDNGYEIKRHINQLFKSGVMKPRGTVTSSETRVLQKPRIEEVQIETKVANTTDEINPESCTQPQALEEQEELRKSNRVRKPPVRFVPF